MPCRVRAEALGGGGRWQRTVTLACHYSVGLCRDNDEIDHPFPQISHVSVSDIPLSLPSEVVNHLAAVAKVVVYEPRIYEVELKVAWATCLSLGRVQQEHKQHAHRLLPKLACRRLHNTAGRRECDDGGGTAE